MAVLNSIPFPLQQNGQEDTNTKVFIFIDKNLLAGTRLRFHKGPNVEWQEVEDFAESEDESDDEGGMHPSPLKVIYNLYAL